MKDFFEKNRKACITAGAIIALLIFAWYLFELFQPGFWLRNTFLYKEKAPFEGIEVYSGKDRELGYRYEMTMAKDGMKTYIAFTVNETERGYEIVSDNSESYYPEVRIFENGELVFSGTFSGFLRDENGEPFEPLVTITTDAYKPTEKELFPSYNWLYNVSQSEKTETRGETFWLIAIVIIGAVTALDMLYPDLFWEIKHFADVSGGEPSDFYRFLQKAGWIISPLITGFLMLMSFAKG